MKPMLTIADIFSTPVSAKLLRALAQSASPRSTRAVALRAGISHTAASATLRDLESLGIVGCSEVGRAHVYSLIRSNIYVRDMILPAIEAEEHIVPELCKDLVDAFAAAAVSLILFGSYAYGEEDTDSDIDVFALAEDSLRQQQLEERAIDVGPIFSEKYGSSLSLMAHSRRDAERILDGGKSGFATELASTGIILHGLGIDEWGFDESSGESEGHGG